MAESETPAPNEEEIKKKEEKEAEEKRLDLLQSRLTHLKRRPYYYRYLDLSEANLRRWLKGSDNCPLLAAARLRASVAQRKELNNVALSPSYRSPKAMEYYIGVGTCGVDRDGSLVYYLLFGRTDMMGILQSCSREQMMVYWALEFQTLIDRVEKHSAATGTAHYNALLIIDFHGCMTHSFCWTALCAWATALQLCEDLYPGLFKEILLINTPVALPVLRRFISLRLKRSTKDRLAIIGSANMLRHLLIRMEKHEIPAYLGGYKCDVDNNPYCRQTIVWPEKVPRWMYKTNPCLSADVMELAVDAGALHKEELSVAMVNTRIVWQLFNVTHPVTLRVMPPTPPPSNDSCRDLLDRPRPVYTARLKAQAHCQGGAISCPAPGTYTLVLDNSKDMIHMIRAKVKIDILPPVGYMANFDTHRPLGDLVNFSEPVTPEERKKRRELVLGCPTCPSVDLNSYY